MNAVIFDLAGTLVDEDSLAPVVALQRVVGRHGVEVSVDAIRADMGMSKRDHLQLLLPDLTLVELDRLTEEVIQELLVLVDDRSTLMRGVPRTLTELEEAGVRWGVTTGYPFRVARRVLEHITRQGFDCGGRMICASDVRRGRPHPETELRCARLLGVPAERCVKVGDTRNDMMSGNWAGMHTVGVTTGNCDRADLLDAGARQVIDSMPELLQLL